MVWIIKITPSADLAYMLSNRTIYLLDAIQDSITVTTIPDRAKKFTTEADAKYEARQRELYSGYANPAVARSFKYEVVRHDSV